MNKICFFISPIGADCSPERLHSDKVLKYLLNPVCEELGYETIRADQLTGTTSIIQDIFECLNNSELVIADVTINNPNVFLEIGYRLKTQKKLILIKDNDSSEVFPFDISGYRHLIYSLDIDKIEDSKEKLKKFITTNIPKPEKIFQICNIDGKGIEFYSNGTFEQKK